MELDGGSNLRGCRGLHCSAPSKARESLRPIKHPIPEISFHARPRATGVRFITKDQSTSQITVSLDAPVTTATLPVSPGDIALLREWIGPSATYFCTSR
jgi:hypothetical protein